MRENWKLNPPCLITLGPFSLHGNHSLSCLNSVFLVPLKLTSWNFNLRAGSSTQRKEYFELAVHSHASSWTRGILKRTSFRVLVKQIQPFLAGPGWNEAVHFHSDEAVCEACVTKPFSLKIKYNTGFPRWNYYSQQYRKLPAEGSPKPVTAAHFNRHRRASVQSQRAAP